MTNFTTEIKKEIKQHKLEKDCCKTAAISAFLRTSGCINFRENNITFEMASESESTMEFLLEMFEKRYAISLSLARVNRDNLNRKDRFVFECLSTDSFSILQSLGVTDDHGNLQLGITEELLQNNCCKIAYIKGSFLGSGSCTLPKTMSETTTGYHLQIVFPEKEIASDFCDLLCDYEVLPRLISRNNMWVVYLQSKETISDFLHVIGVEGCLQKLSKLVDKRDWNNQNNRKNNCFVGNMDKSATVAAKQRMAIEGIRQTVGLDSLDPILKELALARLQDESASYQQLAKFLNISKSCLSHRMRKLMEIADTLLKE